MILEVLMKEDLIPRVLLTAILAATTFTAVSPKDAQANPSKQPTPISRGFTPNPTLEFEVVTPAAEITPKEPFDWDEIIGGLREITDSERRVWVKEPVKKIMRDIDELHTAADAYLGRRAATIEALEKQDRDPSGSSYLKEIKKWLGNLDIDPKRVMPPYEEKDFVERQLEEFQNTILDLRDKRRISQDVDSTSSYSYVEGFIRQAMPILSQVTGEPAREQCQANPIQITLDPSITPSPEGLQFFDQDKKMGEDMLSEVGLRYTCGTDILTAKDRYGSKVSTAASQASGKSSASVVGVFTRTQISGNRLVHGAASIDNERAISAYGDIGRKLVLGHEGVGHRLDVSFDTSLANLLEPEQLAQALRSQTQVLNDPEWGVQDRSISRIFRAVNYTDQSLVDYVLDPQGMDPETFMNYAGAYPINRLFEIKPVTVLPLKGAIGYSSPGGLFDQICDDPAPDSPRFGLLPSPADPTKSYNTLSEFIADYMPTIDAAAHGGNFRASVVRDRLKSNMDDLGKFGILYTGKLSNGEYVIPTDDKTAATWRNYLNYIVAGASL
jgi:hypothetical protein